MPTCTPLPSHLPFLPTLPSLSLLFFFNDTPPTEIYTLSLHDALPISASGRDGGDDRRDDHPRDGHAWRARRRGPSVHRSAARGVGPGRRPEAIPRGASRRGRAGPRRVRPGFPHRDRGAARGAPDRARRRGTGTSQAPARRAGALI